MNIKSGKGKAEGNIEGNSIKLIFPQKFCKPEASGRIYLTSRNGKTYNQDDSSQ